MQNILSKHTFFSFEKTEPRDKNTNKKNQQKLL